VVGAIAGLMNGKGALKQPLGLLMLGPPPKVESSLAYQRGRMVKVDAARLRVPHDSQRVRKQPCVVWPGVRIAEALGEGGV
jgi:hypothetical protein